MQLKTINNFLVLPVLILVGKYLAIISMFALLIACAPVSPLISAQDNGADIIQPGKGNHNHDALAQQYEKLAEEMQAKAEEQLEALEHSHTSRFGKNAKNTKSRIALKIRSYEQAQQEYKEKAAYHRSLAGKSTVIPGHDDGSLQIDKAKVNLKHTAPN
ncbi:hypothetical protein [Nitrosomonas aestuarii]|uniref:hypothetical protein n=1 Tax=Nitrosomonas aestuarii TaxID=52441 RepID=UPI000D313443|nr:hypothetical protein [Nitrosomonas aestuarii]PTN12694.1 hypothetical protein C8R11_103263 [Nitrosomonas aestuarii]